MASTSAPFIVNGLDSSSLYIGTVTLKNVLLSGRDAIPSGYGSNCLVYVRHKYVNLANNIPMVTSWETSVQELTMGDSPFWTTYVPEDNYGAYGGKIDKDLYGNDILMIPDPKTSDSRSGSRKKHYFDSALLLTRYAAENYYHFVSEVLPSLVMMMDRVRGVLTPKKNRQDDARDVLSLFQIYKRSMRKDFFACCFPRHLQKKMTVHPWEGKWISCRRRLSSGGLTVSKIIR